MREVTKEKNESIDKYIQSISKPTGVNLFDNSNIVKRLERFVEEIDKEIDCEYEKRPISVEDNVRKNAYCYALEKCKTAINNILDGREFNDLGE